MLTASAGEAIMAHRFLEYQPWKGDIERRTNGSLIAMEAGTAYAYAIDKLQDRGRFFIFPQEEVYAGQVVGESAKDRDIVINVTKSKKLTNMRASGADDKAKIVPPVVFSLEEALEYIKEDEYVEVTPIIFVCVRLSLTNLSASAPIKINYRSGTISKEPHRIVVMRLLIVLSRAQTRLVIR